MIQFVLVVLKKFQEFCRMKNTFSSGSLVCACNGLHFNVLIVDASLSPFVLMMVYMEFDSDFILPAGHPKKHSEKVYRVVQ